MSEKRKAKALVPAPPQHVPDAVPVEMHAQSLQGNQGLAQDSQLGAAPSELDRRLSNRAMQRVLHNRRLQRKPTLSHAGDSSERAANRMGAMLATAPCAACATGTPCGRHAQAGVVPTRNAPSRDSSTRDALGAGQALSAPLQSFFAPHIGVNLQSVRVHTSDAADTAARSMHAEAFTIGGDIGFRRGRFAPETASGRGLLGHELTHVAQQAEGSNSGQIQRQETAGEGSPSPEGDGRIHAPAAPAPVEDTPGTTQAASFYYGRYRIANDADFMRGELRRVIARIGIEAADAWLERLVSSNGRRTRSSVIIPFPAHTRAMGRPRLRSAYDVGREDESARVHDAAATLAIPVTQRVYREVKEDAESYLVRFERRAKDITYELLRESRARTNAERIRYGLRRIEIAPADYSTDDYGQPERPNPLYRHEMSSNLSNRGLAGAAKDLKEKLDAIRLLREQRSGLYIYSRGFVGVIPANQARYDSLGEQAEERQREFSILRAVYQERYPILASLATNATALGALSQGPGSSAAEVLNRQIYGTLDDISTVEQELRHGSRVKVWKLNEIVYLAKQATGALDQTTLGRMRDKVVEDKRQQVEDDETFRNTVITVLAIGLALIAAIPTGGSSLIAAGTALAGLASLGVSLHQAADHFQEYQIQEAMTGTDFDRARAISTEDPSLFWLAVDIVGAALDVGPALRATRTLITTGRTAFSRLAPLARRAIGTGRAASDALAELRLAAATERGGAGLVSRLVRSVERLRGGASVEAALGRAAGHESRAVARAVRELESGTARAIASRTTRLGGHTVSVAPNGWIIRCSVCGQLREEFAMELARSPSHARRVFAAEDLGRRAAAAREAGNLSEATRLAEQAADEARLLADELEAIRRTREIRMFRSLRPQAIDDLLLMDERLIVDMPFVGRRPSGANAEGWLRSGPDYWQEILRRHPDAFDAGNRLRILGRPPLERALAPTNNPAFRRYFPQYDNPDWFNDTLIHHHIGGGGQAVGVPATIHPGSGGIHNIEDAALITGADAGIAAMLQRLLDRTPAP